MNKQKVAKYFGWKLIRFIVLMVAVAIFSFVLLDLSPIDPVNAYLHGAAVSEAQRAILEQYFGTNTPMTEKIFHWLMDLIRGDLGTSLIFRRPVIDVIIEKFTVSFVLMAISWIVSGVLGFALGVVAGKNKGTWIDKAVKVYCYAIQSAPSFWVGMLNSIQEICKERTILKREFMTGLSLNSYLCSKVMVLGLMSLVQSILLIGVFAITVGMPEYGLITESVIEFFITAFLTALAASTTGLFVSALFSSPDRAMTLAPILLMPQILCSGLAIELKNGAEVISNFIICRWSMEAFGTTTDLNSIKMQIEQMGLDIGRTASSSYTSTPEHLLTDWGILLLFAVVFLVLARVALSSVEKEGT